MAEPVLQRPTGPNVTKGNSVGTIYIGNINGGKSGETIDGSIRLHIIPDDGFTHIELRTDGVWNDTGLRVSEDSIALGRDLFISAAANFIKTENPISSNFHTPALIPHITFSQVNGSLFPPHTPVLGPVEIIEIFSNPVLQVLGTTLGQIEIIAKSQLIQTITYQVGTVGASSQVTNNIYEGNDNTGTLINQRNLPASALIANQPLVIDYNSSFGFSESENIEIFVEFVSADLFSLQTDVSGNIVSEFLTQELDDITLITDELVLSNDLSITFANDLGWVYHNRF